MPMMTSHILKSVDFTKAKKSRYLENETLFYSQTKNNQLLIKGYFMAKNSFVVEVTVNCCLKYWAQGGN